MTFATNLEVDNSILRGPQNRYIESEVVLLENENRGRRFGQAPETGGGWLSFTAMFGHWHIHKNGNFTIETKSGDIASISGTFYPETCPETEIGYAVFQSFKSQSITYNTESRTRRYAYENLILTTLTTSIVPDSAHSQRFAKRISALYKKTYKPLLKTKIGCSIATSVRKHFYE